MSSDSSSSGAGDGWDRRWAQISFREAVGALLSVPKLLSGPGDDPDAPDAVRGDRRALELLAVAKRFGRAGREDSAAVRELQNLAGDRRKTLEIAERSSRLGGAHREHADANRTFRLLRAALDDAPVVEVSEQERAYFALLDEVCGTSRPAEERWRDLAQREPRLEQLRREVLAGDFGPRHDLDAATSSRSRSRESQQRQLAASRGGQALMDAVDALAGPHAWRADPVMRSRRAQHAIYTHLEHQRPGGSDHRPT